MAHYVPKITYGSFVPTVITFTYPPTEPDRERTTITRKVSESLSGVRQVQLYNQEAVRKLKFRFLSESLVDSLETFVRSWAAQGKSFRYYEDQNGSDYVTYELDQEKFEPKMITAVGANAYIHEVDLQMRRVLDEEIPEGVMSFAIANNQGVAANVTGLLLDGTQYRSVQIFFEIWRKTASSERVANGWFKCFYHEDTAAWTLEQGPFEGDAAAGLPAVVTFSVTTGGQVQYTSDNQAGASYDSEALFRNFTILAG